MVNYQEVEVQFVAKDPQHLRCLVPKLIDIAGDHTIWLFHGDMGAGKTTLIQTICEAKAVVDQVTSPTFSLINEYHNLKNEVFYHFDFYRLNRVTEALDIGCDEYFDSGNICFIEWPIKISSILPDRHLCINIQVKHHETRLITVQRND